MVLFLWCVRKTFVPTLWLGFIVAIVAYGNLDSLSVELSGFDDPGAMLSSLLSPLGVLVAALGIRIAGNIVALGASFPLTLSTRHSDYREGWHYTLWFRVWWDRLYLARAYRSLRWSWAVRNLARRRLGESARIFVVCETVARWASVVLFIMIFVVAAIFAE